MDGEYLAEFGGTYLEDSHFLGITAEGADLRLKMLFALTIDHAEYTAPVPGEQHCYREGWILIERPSILALHARKPTILFDPDGSLDFGYIELVRQAEHTFRVVTEWFDVTLESPSVSVHLPQNVR